LWENYLWTSARLWLNSAVILPWPGVFQRKNNFPLYSRFPTQDKYAKISIKMQTKVFNYRVIIKPDERTGNGKACFSAFCPTLGIADDGDTFEEALANIEKLIKFHLECLAAEKARIPVDEPEKEILTTAKIRLSARALSFR
jgi:predicted RNase H-like HicB family nuclease